MTEQEKRNCEGLMYLTWDMFDSPDQPGSGYKFMEREPVLLLDGVLHITDRKNFTKIVRAYVTPSAAKRLALSMNDSHRIGKAILLRVPCPKKKKKLIKALLELGAWRVAVQRNGKNELVYFDTDEQQEEGFYQWILKE